jgi:aryl-alcohol dehydrogenase-like predicted oxidoreductase
MTFGGRGRQAAMGSLGVDQARRLCDLCIDHGVNLFDTADIYSAGLAEEVLGAALKGKRQQVLIATKAFMQMGPGANELGLSRSHLIEACEASLRRLGTDYIDLYQIHRFDKETPIAETAEALNDLVRVGKVRYIGASSMYAYQFLDYLRLAERNGWSRFVSMQNFYAMIYREEEREMLPLCAEEEIGVIPWSPLAGGYLNGTHHRVKDASRRSQSDLVWREKYLGENDRLIAERNVEVAKRLDVKPAQLALAWVLANPVVTAPIIGATKLAHIDDAVAALSIKIAAEDKKLLDAPYAPHPIIGH